MLNIIILGSDEFKIMARGKHYRRSTDKKTTKTVIGGFINI